MLLNFEENGNNFFVYNMGDLEAHIDSKVYNVPEFTNNFIKNNEKIKICVMYPVENGQKFAFQYISPFLATNYFKSSHGRNSLILFLKRSMQLMKKKLHIVIIVMEKY